VKKHITKIIAALILTLGLSVSAYDDTKSSQVQILTILKNNEYQMNTLSERVKYLQDTFYSMSNDINSLKQSLTAEKQKNAQLEKEISQIKQQIQSDKVQTQKSLDAAVNKIAQETSKAVNEAVKSSKSLSSPALSEKNPPSGKFYKYTIQEGATLTTIAKAYKVSVDSIKKANNLKNDNITTGHILLIPKLD